MYYVGLDIHKKAIAYCIKEDTGKVLQEGSVAATRTALDSWLKTVPAPWSGAMEATMFTGWVYDHLLPQAASLKVAHPLMLRAIAAAKKKNDRVDASKLADCLRCGFLPEAYVAPARYRDLRRVLRYRNLMVRQMVQLKNKMAGLLMEAGVTYDKKKLHQVRYFAELMTANDEVPPQLRPLLKLNREHMIRVKTTERTLLRALEREPLLEQRVRRLMTIPAVGIVTALSWALEVAEVQRFSCLKKAVSYCGLCGDEDSSAGVAKRTPLSKQSNHDLQTVLIEAAKLAPRFDPQLALVYEQELQKGNRNRATLAVARKLAAYLLAIDRRDRPFAVAGKDTAAA